MNKYQLDGLISGIILLFLSLSAPAQEKTIWVHPDTARKQTPDFSVQGEYRGEIRLKNGFSSPMGAHLIALGSGTFRLVLYPGGLPGDGWNEKIRFRSTAERQEEQITFKLQDAGPLKKAVLRENTFIVRSREDRTVGEAQKVQRTSPTLGEKPPDEAIVLFDGTRETFRDHWREGASMTEDGLLKQGAKSRDRFRDAKLHMEFRLPFKPDARGQDRGNSGVYLQGRYEIQLLDSFGLKPAKNRCGAIYDVHAPKVDATFPPLTWQTYDVRFHAAEYTNGEKTEPATMTVRHNGVVIHKKASIPKATRAAPFDEGSIAGPLYLQDHGNPVRFRNIWVKPLNK